MESLRIRERCIFESFTIIFRRREPSLICNKNEHHFLILQSMSLGLVNTLVPVKTISVLTAVETWECCAKQPSKAMFPGAIAYPKPYNILV